MLSSRNTNISSTSFTDNVAKHLKDPTDSPITSGGAIYVESLSNVRIVDSTFEGNTAVGSEKEHEEEGLFIARPNPQFQSCPVILYDTAEGEGHGAVVGTVSMTNVSLILNRGAGLQFSTKED